MGKKSKIYAAVVAGAALTTAMAVTVSANEADDNTSTVSK